MPRERDKNRQLFHKGHYEVIAARFREEISRYSNEDGQLYSEMGDAAVQAMSDLAVSLADRFEFDNELFDRKIFLERCGVNAE